MTRARSSSRRFSMWPNCFLFMRHPAPLGSDRRPFLVPPYPQHNLHAVALEQLLPVRFDRPGAELETTGKGLLLNEVAVRPQRIERFRIAVDPEMDARGVLVARV